MTDLMNQLQDYLDSQEWNYEYREQGEYYIMRMNLKTVDACTTILQKLSGGDAFTVYSIFPIKVPEENRMAAAEYLTRANYGLNHGNFELDFDDGEVRYKVSVMCEELDELPNALLDHAINLGFCMLDRYGKGLLSVLYGNAQPAAAIDAIENSDD